MMIRKTGNRVRLFTRRGYDWTARYSAVMAAGGLLKANSATIDGELVCLKRDGRPCFDRWH